ncbi:type IV toxin-antitoxin system AbiEi family antitoxin [Sphingomonas sp. MG17]|uniref:Type IV toxin-antitoxin system AbiEi family antitoxin n=1 Tax=Sphingomonas tagetis TaxID=2949092 RepID=A0A9X2HJP9_9SPHN|nr:type IV toxin-antitoxin system AbiEi family antitoxin [Sphingomonas tagetis]MCP3731342.1 type IV toxin-antitoxin system AbiEi family antitoxin [Sphingomonas tagetis]
MSSARADKLKTLLDAWEPNSVATNPWLKRLGISSQDLQNYTTSRWLVSLGKGAFKRPMETVTWQGALHSLQTQLNLPVHVGALTALEMTGNRHYVRFAPGKAYLFSPLNVVLPLWFRNNWADQVRHVQTKLLPPDLGVTQLDTPQGFALKAASVERSALELLHLAPKEFDLVEASMLIESMTSIRPALMQELLEQCASIKVRRLFLYLAERANLPVVRHLDLARIDLGAGDRSLVPNGRYVAKYQLTLPRELVGHG